MKKYKATRMLAGIGLFVWSGLSNPHIREILIDRTEQLSGKLREMHQDTVVVYNTDQPRNPSDWSKLAEVVDGVHKGLVKLDQWFEERELDRR